MKIFRSLSSLLLVLLLATEALGASYGFDFRATQPFVADPVGTTFVIDTGGGFASAYPTTRNGITFGWTVQPGNLRDRDSALDPRLAGINFGGGVFRVDLPSAGTYTIDLALGDPTGGATQVQTRILDNTTLLRTIGLTSLSSGQFVDAAGTTHASAAAWVSGHQTIDLTFATSTFFLTLDNSLASIAHLTISSGPPDTIAPTVPTNIQASVISSTQIDLAWTASTDTPPGTVLNYRVERCAGIGCVNFVEVGAPTGTSFSDTGLSANTLYRYRIRAFDGIIFSGYTAVTQATTLAARQATLTWTDLINTDHTGYVIQRKTGVSGTYVDLVTVGPLVRSYVDSTSPQPIACYRLRPVRSGEDGPNSAGDVCTTISAPTAPINLVIGGKIAFGGANSTRIGTNLVAAYTVLKTTGTAPTTCSDSQFTGANVFVWTGYSSTAEATPTLRMLHDATRFYSCITIPDNDLRADTVLNDDVGIFSDDRFEFGWRNSLSTGVADASTIRFAANAAGATYSANFPAGVMTEAQNLNESCTVVLTSNLNNVADDSQYQVFCAFDKGVSIPDNSFIVADVLVNDTDGSGLTYRLGHTTDPTGFNTIANWGVWKLSSTATVPSVVLATCTHYAGPTATGTANGSNLANRFLVSGFWAVAAPDSVLCLDDGVYTGASSMITPTASLSGTSGHPITVRALNDGAARLDGQGARYPVLLIGSSYWIVEGINGNNGSAEIVRLNSTSTNNIVRRFVGWDAGDINAMIFSTSGSNNLFEDIGAFGVARKVISFADSTGGGNTCRRCWGRWEGSTNVGPKDTFELVYNSSNNTYENVIGTWNNGSMPASYVLQNNGAVWTGGGAGTYTSGDVNQPYGVIAESDGAVPNFGSGVFGSLAYVKSADKFQANAVVAYEQAGGGYTFKDVGSLLAGHSGQRAFSLLNGGSGLVASNLTSIATTVDTFQPGWGTITNLEHNTTLGGVSSLWTGAVGATVCNRYVNKTLTGTPLWPWPMNQRILDATTLAASAGHQHFIYQGAGPTLTLVTNPHVAVDVTSEIESIFGTIPAGCRG